MKERYKDYNLGNDLYVWLKESIDPNLKYHQLKYFRFNYTIGIPEGAD